MVTHFTHTPAVELPRDVGHDGPVGLLAYQRAVAATDQLPAGELEGAMQGLFGEVGSLLTVAKKRRRDAAAYPGYAAAIREECGDVLWYFTALVNRTGLDLAVIAQRMFRNLHDWDQVGPAFGTWADVQGPRDQGAQRDLARRLSVLAGLVGELVSAHRAGRLQANRDRLSGELVAILSALTATADAADVDLDEAARGNLEKIFSRYPVDAKYPPPFDSAMRPAERLPRQMRVRIQEHSTATTGRVWVTQTMDGRRVGDPLTDNRNEPDDYRFHDVFHIAYAVHLEWSPILRGLLGVKRKSDPRVDENEDGARAAIIEEGIAAFVFGRALERNLFSGLERLDFDLLKVVHGFVKGFEADRCAYWQWERAILEGYKVFRALKKARGGVIMADLDQHVLEFRADTWQTGRL